MKKYAVIIGVLLSFLVLSVAYVIFLMHSSSVSPAPGVRRDIDISFDTNEKSFAPHVITVTQGDMVYLRFMNGDTTAHGIVIDAFGVNTLARAKETVGVPPFLAATPGHFVFYCPVPDGAHLHEIGTFIVLQKEVK